MNMMNYIMNYNTLYVSLFESIIHFISHHFYWLDDSGVPGICNIVFLRSVVNNVFYTIDGRVLTCGVYIYIVMCMYV
jgi:hypothetical protein